MGEFDRRTYHSITKLFSDLLNILAQRKQIRLLMRGNFIEKSFRERLMLAVTSVNRCRYCSYVHSNLALKEGISTEEIRDLYDGILDNCPNEEVPALLYAQHWAESEGKPQPEVRQRILDLYGEDITHAIELTIRMINTANLIGNTMDLIIYKLSFARLKANRIPRIENPG
jgi:AhpD family alkylhydroperoxidase